MHRSCLLLASFVLVVAWSIGCNRPQTPTTESSQPPKVAETKPEPVKPPEPPTVDPKETWAKLIAQARTELEADQLDATQKQLDELANVYVKPATPDEEQQKEVAALTKQLQTKRKELLSQERDKRLADAQRLLEEGKFTEASEAANFVLAQGPTPGQETKALALRAEVDSRRRSRGLLQQSLKFLGSTESREVAAARIELAKQPDVSMPLLVEASKAADKPVQVANALSLMVALDRPTISIPAMIAVLRRPDQEKNWPDAASAIERLKRPGAGEPLLELALSVKTPEARTAALTALSKVIDPPARTLLAVLPLVSEDGPALAAALAACVHAVEIHDQYDLVARRGIEIELSADDEKRLAALPKRLQELASTGDSGPTAEAARLAKVLAMMTHLMAAEPLQDMKIVRTGAELPENKAAAVLDGVWNTIDAPSMWRYPATARGTILLDLGSERTVTGVRIWNLNDPAALTLGWKEITIFVSRDPSEVRNPTNGIVPTAPGIANPHDYSVLVPIAFQRGRYVEISAKSLWATGEGNSGLTEIQVLGF